jgi:hypothetical protein
MKLEVPISTTAHSISLSRENHLMRNSLTSSARFASGRSRYKMYIIFSEFFSQFRDYDEIEAIGHGGFGTVVKVS